MCLCFVCGGGDCCCDVDDVVILVLCGGRHTLCGNIVCVVVLCECDCGMCCWLCWCC